jgi:hypothetical protein
MGRNPDDQEKRKSFELFRNSQKSVQIITFYELKAKLEFLSELLGPPTSPEPDFESDLEDLDI